MVAAFDPARSSVAALASRLSANEQYQVTGYGELRTWSGEEGSRLLLALSRGAPAAGEALALRLVLPPASTPGPVEWELEGLEPLEPLPSRAAPGETRVRVRALRATQRRVKARFGETSLDLVVPDVLRSAGRP